MSLDRAAGGAGAAASWRNIQSLERGVRLWSGVVLMVFALTHFLNHAVGVFGVEAMGVVQEWRSGFWRSWAGTLLLYGALVVHVVFALKRAIGRRAWRMPWNEALQILLGLLIPVMLLGHFAGTRAAASAGFDDSYSQMLRVLFPSHAVWQSLALIVVWVHGVIGLYYAFHVRGWFRPIRFPFAIVAVLVPALALAGFIAAGREAVALAAPVADKTAAQLAAMETAQWYGQIGIAVVFLFAAAFVLLKAVRGRIGTRLTIRYLGHGEVRAVPGQTLLEISRANAIPHPSACGGRGRCSSCRVLVIAGGDKAPAPNGLESRMLERIRAPKQVRLACQLRPQADMNVRVLLGIERMPSGDDDLGENLDWGVEQELTVLFADIRGFSTLARNQLPADLIVLLNRILGEMSQAIEARGGRVAMVQTDGVMAVFGMGGHARKGAKAALHAAADVLKAVHLVNKDIRASLPLPIRVGIGIHTGEVILSRAESGGGQRIVVIGETVVVANRLEEATKELAADCVASARTIAAAGLSAPSQGEQQVHYKHGEKPVPVYAFGDRQDLRALLGRIASPREAEPRDTDSRQAEPAA
jgi:adenylate cyclase